MAHACGGGAIVKCMAEMCVATGTQNFGPDHAVTSINVGLYVFRRNGLEEARPAALRIEFVARRKQRQCATDAGVNAIAMVVEQRPAERRFRALATRDLVLLVRKLRLPLGVRFDDGRDFDWPDELASVVENSDFHFWIFLQRYRVVTAAVARVV